MRISEEDWLMHTQMTLQEMMVHFFKLYGERNDIFLDGLWKRIAFLSLAISDLKKAFRKDVRRSLLEIALARIVSRIFCIAQHFLALPLVEMLARKYPQSNCSYCSKFPCGCKEKRPDAVLADEASEVQMRWSLEEWCTHLNALYGAKNKRSENACDNLLVRLSDEITEFLSCYMDLSNKRLTTKEIVSQFAEELGDALAWTIAIANFLEIDLYEAVMVRFVYNNCWKCHEKPCICTHFNVKLVHWDEVAIE